MQSSAVIGLGFGDEGKGKVVSYLCPPPSHPALIVRFCGGHQAGHKVMVDWLGTHIFSNFGSGTLQGNPTYWSKFCTVDPHGLLNEYDILKNIGVTPTIFIDDKCPVTTPLEFMINRALDRKHGHGSCGVGVGQTLQREQEHYSLTVGDLQYPWVLKTKLQLLDKYYTDNPNYPIIESDFDADDFTGFMEICQEFLDCPAVKIVQGMPTRYDRVIFEGAQGLLLDQNFGFFPHVTRSNTGMKNIAKLGYSNPTIYLVTRAYQTRHGNGPMSNERFSVKVDNPHEHNSNEGFQGEFRITPLDFNLLKYAINKDEYIRNSTNKILVVTCLDTMGKEFPFSVDSQIYSAGESQLVRHLSRYLGIRKVMMSRSPYSFSMDTCPGFVMPKK